MFVNPYSGKKRAPKIYKDKVLPLLELADISVHTIGKYRPGGSLKVKTSGLQIMVGLGHCPMISKYGPSLFKAVSPVDPSFLVVKKSHFDKNIHLTGSLQTPQTESSFR